MIKIDIYILTLFLKHLSFSYIFLELKINITIHFQNVVFHFLNVVLVFSTELHNEPW